jgi:hypothetical protein
MSHRFCGFLLWMSCSFLAQAQLTPYAGPAIWLPREGAQEEFLYLEGDSLRYPQGAYSWKCSRELSGQGSYELMSVQANFEGGQAQGPLELLRYSLRFAIEDFDLGGVRANTMGDKTVIRGQFKAGRPSGTWLFSLTPLHESREPAQLAFDLSNGSLCFWSESQRFEGTVNSQGYFHGDWHWAPTAADSLSFRYREGILAGYARDGQPGHEAIISREARFFNVLDSLHPAPQDNPWVWNPGFYQIDTLRQIQEPVRAGMEQALHPYRHGSDFFARHPLLSLPPIVGTARFYHPLPETDQQQLTAIELAVQALDSSLMLKLQLPVFLLRRAGKPALDSLMLQAESLLDAGIALQAAVRQFQHNESRYLSPCYLEPPITFGLQSQHEYTRMLSARRDALEKEVEAMLVELAEMRELLLFQGTLEELEEEWVLLQEAMRQKLAAPDSVPAFALRVYQRFVEADHERRTAEYGSIQSLNERQGFLQETLEYNQFFHEFFTQGRYLPLLEIEAFLLEHYTQYLYNPYMAVNNIEVVVKPRFLQAILERYWPFQLNELVAAPDGIEFQTRFQTALEVREKLRQLAYDKSAAARKLARQGRKLGSMPELQRLLRNYQTESL